MTVPRFGKAASQPQPHSSKHQQSSFHSCFQQSTNLCVLVLSHSVVSDSLRPHRLQSARLLCLWGIFQGRIVEWAIMPSSRGSSQPRDQTQVSCIADGFFTVQGRIDLLPYQLLGKSYLYTPVKSGVQVCSTFPVLKICQSLKPTLLKTLCISSTLSERLYFVNIILFLLQQVVNSASLFFVLRVVVSSSTFEGTIEIILRTFTGWPSMGLLDKQVCSLSPYSIQF